MRRLSRRRWRWIWEQVAQVATELTARDDVVDVVTIDVAPDSLVTSASGSRTPGPSDPTGAAVVARDELAPDVVERWIRQMRRDLQEVHAAVLRVRRIVWLLDHRGDRRADGEAGSGACQACDRWVSGSAVDRLRAGLCGACYAAWRRWARTAPDPADRLAFVAWRRRQED